MEMRALVPLAVLLGCGAAWGLTLPLMRVAVETGHAPLGLVLWQKVVMAVLAFGVLRVLRLPLPALRRHLDLFLVVALAGAIVPGYFAFLVADDLPAGIRSIILAAVPLFSLPMAILAGFERPQAVRAVGVVLGAGAIVLIARPEAGVTGAVGLGVILLALISPLSYAAEGTYLASRGRGGLHPVQLLFGASALGVVLLLPLVMVSGSMVWPGTAGSGRADLAILAIGGLDVLAYAGYVWLVGQAGSVFASQVAYVVTGFGVIWSMLLLGERYSPAVWAAFALMLAGIALVQPLGRRPKIA
jgi:drug/metabolite transporter (DMT)-like permease